MPSEAGNGNGPASEDLGDDREGSAEVVDGRRAKLPRRIRLSVSPRTKRLNRSSQLERTATCLVMRSANLKPPWDYFFISALEH